MFLSSQQIKDAEDMGVSVFKPEGWQVNAMLDTSRTMLLTGSAGGGKSRLGYEKIVAFALKYPKSNIIALRKELDDCARSVIPTLDDQILGMLSAGKTNNKFTNATVTKRAAIRCYIFSNGSRIWWAGMRTPAERRAIRSMGAGGSMDMALMEEAIEFDEEDYDELRGRMRGKAAPWTQIILATNPDGPLHWINRRLIIGGEASVHLSNAEMNPYNPREYVEDLKTMTGVEGDRLARGLWVEGSGVVIDTWLNAFQSFDGSDGGGNVSLKAEYIPDGGPVVCAVDDGYAGKYDERSKMFTAQSHPRAFLLAQIRPTGQICVFHEDYAVRERYRVHISRLKATCDVNGWPYPSEIHYDKSSATLAGELVLAGFHYIFPSTSNRDESIKLLKETVAADENGFRGVIVHPRCHHLNLEMASWSIKNGVPMKTFDHGPDALRYLVHNIKNGVTGDGAIGVPGDGTEAADAIEARMREIDRIVNEVERRVGQL